MFLDSKQEISKHFEASEVRNRELLAGTQMGGTQMVGTLG